MNKQNEEEFDELHVFAPLTRYPFSKRMKIYVIDFLLYWTIAIIGKSIRFEVKGWDNCEIDGWEIFGTAYSRNPVTINAFWHDRIFLTTYYWRTHRTSVIISNSFDGEYIARTAQRFGYGVIRGSSTRGGSQALKKMVNYLEKGESMTLTVDGPRGPRHKVKSGAVVLAMKTGFPIIPVVVEPQSFWKLKTWDEMQIPKPFTTACVYIGAPLFLEGGANDETIRNNCLQLQATLDEMVQTAKQWRNGKH
ncbi:MAG: lysophospholipid acyltransferase family protein [Pyrinomonadaceae bacterium]